MSIRSVQSLPPKMAAQFAARAKAGEGHPVGSDAYEFHQGGNVVCVMMFDPPMGHIVRDPHRAARLREMEAGEKAAQP